MSQTQDRIISVASGNGEKIAKGILLAGGIYITYRVGKKIIAELNKDAAQNAADDSPEVRQAIALRSAVNPSGVSFLKSLDTTNVSLVFDTAKTITNLDSVIKAYKNLYTDNLLDDLQGDLSGEEFQKFLNLVSSNQKKTTTGGSAPAVVYAKKGSLVIAKKDVTLRTSPDASNHGSFYEMFSNKNIIRVAKAGEFLGYATGRQQFDEVNNVKFIEVAYLINGAKAPAAMKPKDKQRVSYWVTSSMLYVDIFEFYKPMFDAYVGSNKYTSWMKPDGYFTLKGLPMPRVITTSLAPILDEKLQPFIYVKSNTILGILEVTIDTGSSKYIQFRTIDNTLRWVEKKYITILK